VTKGTREAHTTWSTTLRITVATRLANQSKQEARSEAHDEQQVGASTHDSCTPQERSMSLRRPHKNSETANITRAPTTTIGAHAQHHESHEPVFKRVRHRIVVG